MIYKTFLGERERKRGKNKEKNFELFKALFSSELEAHPTFN
jgi:hypothetical protein